VGDAGDVDQQAVGGVGGDGGRDAHAPVDERLERRLVALGISLRGLKVRDQGQGVGGFLADEEAERGRGRIEGVEPAHAAVGGDQGEGTLFPLETPLPFEGRGRGWGAAGRLADLLMKS